MRRTRLTTTAVPPPATLTVLGIETSCDETAAAVVVRAPDGSAVIQSNVIRAQVDAHTPYAGVVPEIAARAHVEILDEVIRIALADAGLSLDDIDAIAATGGPGLIGGVMVGLVTAKALALALDKPLIAVNHLEGHALSPRLVATVSFPYLLLLVSGGHTQLLLVEGLGRYRRLGSTIDDALGEAFDKVAKLLGLGFPGGPAVEKAAAGGAPARFTLPKPLSGRGTADFSFSGLKTALRIEAERLEPLTDRDVADLCAAFQETVAAIIGERIGIALEQVRAEGVRPTALVAAGGVAANRRIRAEIDKSAAAADLPVILPPPELCTDNAAMIALAGAERLAAGLDDPLDVAARPRWPLDELAEPVYGHGRKGAKA